MNEKGHVLPDHGAIAGGLNAPNEKEIRRLELPGRRSEGEVVRMGGDGMGEDG